MTSEPVALGLQIVPTMDSAELIDTIVTAEELGYSYCMVADEGLMLDVYAVLGAAARATSTIRLGAVTNPYSRHPAATAAAIATVDEMSGGRAFVTLVAGGTMVLHPMGLERSSPLAAMADTIEALRLLWRGEPVTWQGRGFSLEGAQLTTGAHSIPIWVAARGERMLAAAGAHADGLVLMVKSDLGDAFGLAEQARAATGAPPLTRVYLDRLAYNPEMIEEAKHLYGYAIMDSPPRVLKNLGLNDAEIAGLKHAFTEGGPEAVGQLVTDELVASYQIAGTPAECRSQLEHLIGAHRLDAFFVNIISPGPAANRDLLSEVVAIAGNANL
ncbi:MAG: LLM class flavin-dependent oxidoreductase [Acidimicrobiaceae bacterium]|nr:LLM class flavin-dependent oxidoreductase [Acidimicrobiaceae bacterium]MYE96212.1 LLM class flavin-dependent oxidoreductase [Acidimicrobiaceae bacterium]MYI52976.1 LLM class flavin-dependent oxidoreductase [Acidimicrobiaceae bacterium]